MPSGDIQTCGSSTGVGDFSSRSSSLRIYAAAPGAVKAGGWNGLFFRFRYVCPCAPAESGAPPGGRNGRARGNGRGARAAAAPWFSRLFATLRLDASVAQLDRASVFGTEGWEFEPLRTHSKSTGKPTLFALQVIGEFRRPTRNPQNSSNLYRS